MASLPSHAVFALALGSWLAPEPERRRTLLAGAMLAMLPDSDALGHWLGVARSSLLAHRGITHSLSMALGVGLGVGYLLSRQRTETGVRLRMLAYCVVAMLSHGLLDACTDGGRGVAFFAPWSGARYFFPFRPITVSPIGIQGVFGERGLRILLSEARWIGVPSALLIGSALLWRAPARGHPRD